MTYTWKNPKPHAETYSFAQAHGIMRKPMKTEAMRNKQRDRLSVLRGDLAYELYYRSQGNPPRDFPYLSDEALSKRIDLIFDVLRQDWQGRFVVPPRGYA